MQYDSLLERLKQLSREASDAIMDVYQRDDFGTRVKSDDSPLTEADLASHRIIEAGLRALTPSIPVLSEESQEISFEQRQSWQRYWLVDPLDGTKEFIARNDDFTTNIALIENHKAVLGMICQPTTGELFFAAEQLGAHRQLPCQSPEKLSVSAVPGMPDSPSFRIVASRRHGVANLDALCQSLGQFELISRGSSLKMCQIASGLADFYPRLAPTSEWDTAAAQVIVEQAGGQLVDQAFKPLQYNTKDSLLNPNFYVLGSPDIQWQALLSSAN